MPGDATKVGVTDQTCNQLAGARRPVELILRARGIEPQWSTKDLAQDLPPVRRQSRPPAGDLFHHLPLDRLPVNRQLANRFGGADLGQ